MEPVFIPRKGGTVLLYNGHQYYKNATYKNEKTLWRCASFKKLKCKGYLTLQNKNVIKVTTHECPCKQDKNDVDIAMVTLKENVVKMDGAIPNLYKEAVGKLVDAGLHLVTDIPEFRNVQHGLYNARNKNLGVKKIISTVSEEVEVPSKFSDFILADYCYEGNRIIMFCSQETRGLIHNITEFFFDATYKSCPKPFYQLLTVHGEVGSSAETTNVIPLIFILMSNKTQASYCVLFSLLKKELAWNPLTVHCDYELAAINAITIIFPNVKIIGCYYHWSRCVWRKAKLLGNTKLAVERRLITLCAKLPLLPYETIFEAWQYIKSEALTNNMNKFFQYFEKFWISSTLCKYISVFGQRHRTNNSVESWNSKINRALNKNTVNILRLLNYLEKTDKQTHINFKNKQITNKRKKEDIEKDDTIRNIQLQVLNQEIVLGHALEKFANIR